MAENTEQDKDVIRRAAFGAVALVSKADPGFFATFKESAAGSKVLASAPENIRNLFKGGLVAPPTGSAEEVEKSVLADLQTSVQSLSPADATGYRDVVTAAIEAVAAASKGVAPAEQAIIDKIKAALAGGGQATAPAPADGQAPAPAPTDAPSAPPTPSAPPSATVPPVPGPPPTPGTPPVPSPPPTPGTPPVPSPPPTPGPPAPPAPPAPPTEPVPPAS